MSDSQNSQRDGSASGAEADGARDRESEPLTDSYAEETRPVETRPDGEAPSKIEGYRIVRLLGQGGMGEVYEAEQVGAVRRRVAIKEIKRGMDSRAIVNRFEAERQALAMMDHPGIAKIFDAGLTDDHRPFFAMEYVEGVPITEYCDEHRLDLRQRIELFVQVCRAVQHAHLKGIVHRDIKPTNVLVTLQDGEPVPKVIDFGLAKAMTQPLTERDMQTELGQTLGTMEYMSPEQADLLESDVDTRTDVYSLGCLLYELLAGTLPFTTLELSTGGYFRALRRIREDDPAIPSRKLQTDPYSDGVAERRGLRHCEELTRRLGGDLDWIVMMALEKDRARRYQTVNALVDDLQRHLNDEPVVAAQPSVHYRVGKFIRRHRVGFATSTLLVVLVVAFSIAMALQAARIAEERDRANLEAQTAEQSLDFLVELFEAVRGDEGMGDTVTARQILDVGREQLGQRLGDQPLVRARLLDTVGQVYLSLGHTDEATPLVESALEIRERELGRPSKEVAVSLMRLARVHDNRGESEEAEALAREALQMLEAEPGTNPLDRSEVLRILGWTLARQGKYVEAESAFRQALDSRRGALEADDLKVARCLYALAAALYQQGRYEELKPLLDEALKIFERNLGTRHIMVRTILNLKGIVARAEGRLEEGEAYTRQALEITETVLGPNSRLLASDLNTLALLLDSQGRSEEAEALGQRALAIYERTVGKEHTLYGTMLGNLAWFAYRQQKYAKAENLYEETLAIYEKVLDPEHPSIAAVQLDFAKMLLEVRSFDRALELVDSALATQLANSGEQHPVVADGFRVKGCILRLLGRETEAEALLKRALAIQIDALGSDHPETVRTRELLSDV